MAGEAAGKARRIHGSCHCGNIRFEFDSPHGSATIPVRACGCSFCQKNGGVWTSHPDGPVRLLCDDLSRVERYRFGTKTADFYVCSTCGVAPVAVSDIDGTSYAVVNVNCFDDVDRAEFVQSATDFEGEATAERLARRQRNWSPLVMAA